MKRLTMKCKPNFRLRAIDVAHILRMKHSKQGNYFIIL